ncbi:MAG: IS4 family transposase [Chloroflexi bacterium]|nr:IS4 family transposase [Chloroflexota bacterium]
MLSNPQLYDTWRQQLQQLTPDECESRLTNMLWLVVGLYLAGSVHLTKIARKLPIRAQKLSLDKRLRRFLSNHAIRPRSWYHPVASGLLAAAGTAGQVHLIIDGSKVSAGHQLLMVGIAYRRRALPLAWTWVRCPKGHSTTRKQIALLSYVHALVPRGVQVSLVGDCEFGRPLLLEYLDWWGWDYALRQPGKHLVMTKGDPTWRRLDSLPLKPGETIWLGHVVLTKASAYPTHLLLHWAKGEKEPWFLASNLLLPRPILRLYRRRMWLEELFGDMKGHGFDLEHSRLRHFLRLSRLTLAVCLLYVWLVAMGEHVLLADLCTTVDRSDRRDLSIFRLGWDFIERCLALHDPFPDVFVPNFCSVSGS